MAGIYFEEKRNSRSSTDEPKTVTMRYTLAGITSDTDARAYCRLNIPRRYSGLYRHNVRLDSVGAGVWDVEAEFNPSPNDFRWTFDTTGGQAHITHAVAHVGDFGLEGKTPPNHNGAIGVNSDGDVEGCEIGVSARKWSETWQFDASLIPFTYGDTLESLTFTVNASTFRGKSKGYVLFLGASGGGSNRDPGIVEMTYNFATGLSLSNRTISGIAGVSKLPWEYLWYEYSKTEDSEAKRKLRKLIAIHQEQVYEYASFGDLGIGTGPTPGT